ncbi:MAG: SprT family zinc-dependent metalloprotease [Alphaproteobacteria bacterium]|nr:SprT family zinc-dependent metalloprotease [Alphaproteobacteria bacterium]
MAADYAFEFEIKRSRRRKTLCLQIREGQVQVMVPARTPERQIKALLDKHTPWVHRKLREQAARPAATPKAYVQGEIYTYLGLGYRLKIVQGPPWPAERVGGDLVVTLPARLADGARQAKVKERLCEWYRQAALEEFQARTQCYSRRLGVAPSTVKVKSYKRRWGSCSARGEISYNWRLIIAPGPVVDYVAAHEVAHLIQHNHSPDFWRLVAGLMPDFRRQQAWLNEFGGTLAI